MINVITCVCVVSAVSTCVIHNRDNCFAFIKRHTCNHRQLTPRARERRRRTAFCVNNARLTRASNTASSGGFTYKMWRLLTCALHDRRRPVQDEGRCPLPQPCRSVPAQTRDHATVVCLHLLAWPFLCSKNSSRCFWGRQVVRYITAPPPSSGPHAPGHCPPACLCGSRLFIVKNSF